MKDKILENLINKEIKCQEETINLIASENFVSKAVLKILGSPLTNKYSEGYPGKRYYSGCFHYDKIEKLAQERALKAFHLKPNIWSVNVQPYSGSPANLAIYSALMKPGEVLMGMSLTAGGHLTHGHKVNLSGKLYKVVQYGLNPKTGLFDYKELERLSKKYKPKIIVSGSTAYPRKIDFKKIGEIAKKAGAYHLADISHIAGLVATDLHPSPFLYADIVMTTTHKTLRGPRGAVIFSNHKSQIANNNKINLAEAINRAVFPGMQGGPHNNVIAAIAEMFFEALQIKFKTYQRQIIKNTKVLAQALIDFGFTLMTGGTDNHLILIDLRKFSIDGLGAEKKLENASITTNRNSLIGDLSPLKPSGLRLGTPAITTRGMKEKEMKKIAEWIYRVIVKKEEVNIIKKEIQVMAKKFPLFY